MVHGTVGTKAERDELRRAMLARGCTLRQIAAEMGRRWNFRPRTAWRHAHGWTQDEVAARYNKLLGRVSGPMTRRRISDYEQWPVGGIKPTNSALTVLAKVYQSDPLDLVDFQDRKMLSKKDILALEFVDKQDSTGIILAYENEIEDMSLDQMRHNIITFNQLIGSEGFLRFLPQMMTTRNHLLKLLQRSSLQHHKTDLYFLSGVLSGALANATSFLGQVSASRSHNRDAMRHAEIIGFNSLRAWCYTMDGSELIDTRPEVALKIAHSGQAGAPKGIWETRLSVMEAHILANMGNSEKALEIVKLIHPANEATREHDELYDDIEGSFGGVPGGRYVSMAGIYLRLGMAHQITDIAPVGIELFELEPEEDRGYGDEIRLHLYLASAYVLLGQLDAAQAALTPAIAIPTSKRPAWVGSEVKLLLNALNSFPDHRSTKR